jgi:hypothetical protein
VDSGVFEVFRLTFLAGTLACAARWLYAESRRAGPRVQTGSW